MSAVIGEKLFLDRSRVEFLLEMGAIYRNRKRQVEDCLVGPEDIVRVHTLPKRFPTDWKWGDRIVFQDEAVVVVDKPAGIPVHATLDNRIENVAQQLGDFLEQRLYVTHRLDTVTSGLMVLAKAPQSQSDINKLFSRRLVKKSYIARIPIPVALGHHVHFMAPSWRAPRVVVAEEHANWARCELIITDIQPQREYFLANIDLLTGRTHQIRAQLAALGASLAGDTQYGSDLPASFFHLRCTHLAWPGRSLTCGADEPGTREE